jgi:ubiquinone/menaquinone biosynthesis C-methylase UbiE
LKTVLRLPLTACDAVLDLCCGAGASAIPAARAIGRAGYVLGVDVAGPLLAMARAKAAREDLAEIEFRQGNVTHTGLADGSFDAVVCVFAVFFARYGGVRRGDVAAGPRRRGTLTRGTAPADLTG